MVCISCPYLARPKVGKYADGMTGVCVMSDGMTGMCV